MGRSVLVSALVLIGVAACGQGGIGQHRLVGTVYEDLSVERGLEMAFVDGETVEMRFEQRSRVTTCNWVDKTEEAKSRGENVAYIKTPIRYVENAGNTGGYWDTTRREGGEPQRTDEPASFRIEVSCPLPLGSGMKRFEVAFAKDLETATRVTTPFDFGGIGGSFSDGAEGVGFTRAGD